MGVAEGMYNARGGGREESRREAGIKGGAAAAAGEDNTRTGYAVEGKKMEQAAKGKKETGHEQWRRVKNQRCKLGAI